MYMSEVGSDFFSLWILYLGIKMTDENITLNCLIVPIGELMNIPCIKVIQAITIHKNADHTELEAAIQSRLSAI